MEDPTHAHPPLSPSARSSKQARPSKISQTFSSLKGIIRIPARRTQDERDVISTGHQRSGSNTLPLSNNRPTANNAQAMTVNSNSKKRNEPEQHPYGRRGGSLGTKPYMSQPMLGLGIGLAHTQDDDIRHSMDNEHSPGGLTLEDGYEDGEDTPSSASGTPEHSPSRSPLPSHNHKHQTSQKQNSTLNPSSNQRPGSKTNAPPQTPGHARKFSAHSISNALVSGTQVGFSMLGRNRKRGASIDGLPTRSSIANSNSILGSGAAAAGTVINAGTRQGSRASPPSPPSSFSADLTSSLDSKSQPQPLITMEARQGSQPSPPLTSKQTSESGFSFLKRPRTPSRSASIGGGVKGIAKTLVSKTSKSKLRPDTPSSLSSTTADAIQPPISKPDTQIFAQPTARAESPLPPIPASEELSASASVGSTTPNTIVQVEAISTASKPALSMTTVEGPNTDAISIAPSTSFSSAMTSTSSIPTASATPNTRNNDTNHERNAMSHTTSTAYPTMANPPSGALAPNSHPQDRVNLFPPPTATRRSASENTPRLVLPPANYRFSLNMMPDAQGGGASSPSARLSPSVILRPQPLPLLNLPVLQTPGGSPAPVRKVGLKHMPALPLQGTSRGVGGHEEVDDVEDEDEEEDDEEEDENDTSQESMPTAIDESRSRSSLSSLDDGDEDDEEEEERSRPPSRTSSYETAHADPSPIEPYFGNPNRPPDKRFSRTPHLPRVETSRLDLSFLERPPSPVGGTKSGKGKAKEVSLTQDAGFTPVNTHPHFARGAQTPRANAAAQGGGGGDYFYQPYQHPPLPSRGDLGRSKSLKPTAARSPSPARTPRPGDHFGPSFGGAGTPGLGAVPEMMPMPSTEARLSAAMGGGISQHPGIYKRASRSLIDVHAIEKKERVEQMVRDGEDAEEAERKKKVRALRLSMRMVVQGTPYAEDHTKQLGWSTQEGDADRTPMLEDGPKRDPLKTPPHSADAVMRAGESAAGDAAVADAFGEAGGAALTAGGETSRKKRISMAPAYESLSPPHPLRRRRSMPTFNANTAPPPYPEFAPHPYGLQKGLIILPREDEGKEKLPGYSNEIYLKAIMPRKMEFSKPGLQAKDRKWRRVVCVLEGTSFKVYKHGGASGVAAIGEWWESKVGVGNAITSPVTTTTAFHAGTAASASRGVPTAGGSQSGSMRGGRIRDSGLIRDIELARSSKSGEGGETGQPVLPISSPAQGLQPQPSPPHHQHHSNHSTGVLPSAATKSALSLAVQLLKPASRHGRSNSDVTQSPTRPRSPRSSLNIPASGSGRTTPTMSTNTGSSMRSHSPSMSTSTPLTTPSSSAIFSPPSRPLTPAAPSASPSTSGFRVGAGPHANSSAGSRHGGSSSASRSHFQSGKGKEKEKDEVPDPQECDLIRTYTMQRAECGLGKDYLKRPHVIRVRLEGEQFLLQAKDIESVISWIEGLQSATNISLDLDERPMPAGPIFPRRRRRRRIVHPGVINTQVANAAAAAGVQTPVSATQLVAPLNRSAAPRS